MNQKLASSISIVLNIHREGAFLPITLKSLDAAAANVRSLGVEVELIAVLDNADDITRLAMHASSLEAYSSHKIIEVSNGSLGLSRNDGIELASGEYVFLADADDLISTNYFTATLQLAASTTRDALFFPEFLMAFGDNYHITHYSGLKRTGIFPLLHAHPFISRVCAHRSLFEKIRFEDIRLSEGHAYEDWHFNCQAVAAGYDMQVVKDITLFYRQRPNSLLRSADAMSARQIAPSALFLPSRYVEVCAAVSGALDANPESDGEVWSEFRDSMLSRDDIRAEIELAEKLEPEISVRQFHGVPLYFNYRNSSRPGQAYLDAARILGDEPYTDIFFLPFLTKGGAEKFVIQVIHSLYRSNPLGRILIICGENYRGVTSEGDLPPNVVVLNLPLIDPLLPMEERCLVALKAVERHSDGTRMHFTSSVFSSVMIQLYHKLLSPYRCFFYRFNNNEKFQDGRLVITYSPLEFIKKYIDFFESIICDSAVMMRRDAERLPDYRNKWRLLHAHVPTPAEIDSHRKGRAHSNLAPQPFLERGKSADTQAKGIVFRVLWASRFDDQKRPELLPLIAEGIRDRGLPIEIDAFGFSVFRPDEDAALQHLPTLRYCGPFQQFFGLPLSTYDAFLYTSWNDGLPNVILEAGAAGLPIIAPDVGGISEVIQDGRTGLLLPSLESDQDMARAYVDALSRLSSEQQLKATLVSGFSTLLATSFDRAAHESTTRDIFDLTSNPTDADTLATFYRARAVALRQQYVLEKSWLEREGRSPFVGMDSREYSRAHALADRYIAFAQGDTFGARTFRSFKALIRPIWRRLRR